MPAKTKVKPALPATAPLTAATTPLDALRAACLACVDALRANRAGLVEGRDDEYLHRMRVALRRLRAAFGAFSRLLPRRAAEAQVAQIRWLLRELGPARDWDVFCAATLEPMVAGQNARHRGLLGLQRASARLRERAHARARRAVDSSRYQKMLGDLDDWLAGEDWTARLPAAQARALRGPLPPCALAALERRWRRVRRRGRGAARLDVQGLHRLRIAVKRFRYTAMFFAPLFPEARARAILRACETLQDALGGLNDCANAERMIRQARAGLRGDETRRARALLVERIDAARGEHRRALRPAWKALRSAERFWRAA